MLLNWTTEADSWLMPVWWVGARVRLKSFVSLGDLAACIAWIAWCWCLMDQIRYRVVSQEESQEVAIIIVGVTDMIVFQKEHAE